MFFKHFWLASDATGIASIERSDAISKALRVYTKSNDYVYAFLGDVDGIEPVWKSFTKPSPSIDPGTNEYRFGGIEQLQLLLGINSIRAARSQSARLPREPARATV